MGHSMLHATQCDLFAGNEFAAGTAAVDRPAQSSTKQMYARTDPATSRQAAERMERSGTARTQRQTVLLALGRAQRVHQRNVMGAGLTSAELAVESGLDRAMCARRLPELATQGTVTRAGVRQCQVKGTLAVTWAATQDLWAVED